MATLINNQAINLPTGQQTFGPVNLPNNLTSMTIRFKRCTTATPTIWPDASTRLTANVFVSLDNDVTWIPSGGVVSIGGIAIRGNGSEAVETVLQVTPLPAGVNRRIKAEVTVENGPLVTNVTLEAN